MGLDGLAPRPSLEDHSKVPRVEEIITPVTKAVMPIQRIAKRTTCNASPQRVRSACEQCRIKKTKCDGESPCQRCKNADLTCTAGTRKMRYKAAPPGYVEVLEKTQFTLVTAIHKLYRMVRNSEKWDLGEPELDGHGRPAIHSIVEKLGCLRSNSDFDLSVPPPMPKTGQGTQELAVQAEQHSLAAGSTIATQGMAARSGTALDLWTARYGLENADSHGYVDDTMIVPSRCFTANNDDLPKSQPPPVHGSWAVFPTAPCLEDNWMPPTAALVPMEPQYYAELNQGLTDPICWFVEPHALSGPLLEAVPDTMGGPMTSPGCQ